MKNKCNKIKGHQSQQKGTEYEKFVAEVYNYYENLNKKKDFFITKNYFNKYVSKNEICDVYFSYKDKNGRIKHTFIQCESGKPKYDKINRQNISN